MARRSRGSSTTASRSQAVHRSSIDDIFFDSLVADRRHIQLYQDLRSFHPAGPLRALAAFSSGDGQVVDRSVVRPRGRLAPYFSGHVGFSDPTRVFVCIRRKVRREVLMATRRGRGGRSRRNWRSDIRC